MAYGRFEIGDTATAVVSDIDGKLVLTVLNGQDQVVLVGGSRLLDKLHDATNPAHRPELPLACAGSELPCEVPR